MIFRRLRLRPTLIRYMATAKRAVIRVGGGRGFVVEAGSNRLVITAARCLPRIPPCRAYPCLKERIYEDLLGPLGEELTVWAECRHFNPVADIAVLSAPDHDEHLSARSEHYKQTLGGMAALPIAPPPKDGLCLMLSMTGEWFDGRVYHDDRNGLLLISEAAESIPRGMYGSPILAENGAAIGLVSNSSESPGVQDGVSPCLSTHLPLGIWRTIKKRGVRKQQAA